MLDTGKRTTDHYFRIEMSARAHLRGNASGSPEDAGPHWRQRREPGENGGRYNCVKKDTSTIVRQGCGSGRSNCHRRLSTEAFKILFEREGGEEEWR